jgi:hypothetical protein
MLMVVDTLVVLATENQKVGGVRSVVTDVPQGVPDGATHWPAGFWHKPLLKL